MMIAVNNNVILIRNRRVLMPKIPVVWYFCVSMW